jgi:hypothetical protein
MDCDFLSVFFNGYHKRSRSATLPLPNRNLTRMVAGNVVLVFSLQAVLHGLVEVGLALLVDHFSLKNTRAKYQFYR